MATLTPAQLATITKSGIPDATVLVMSEEAVKISDNYTANLKPAWERWKKIRDDIRDTLVGNAWNCNAVYAYVSSKILTVKPRLNNAFYSSRPYFDVKPRGDMDDAQALDAKRTMDYIFERASIPTKSDALFDSALTYGTGFFRTGVRIETQWQVSGVDEQEPIGIGENGQPIYGVKKVGRLGKKDVWMGADVWYVPLWDIIWCPGYRSVKDAPYIGERTTATWQEIVTNKIYEGGVAKITGLERQSLENNEGFIQNALELPDKINAATDRPSTETMLPIKGGDRHELVTIWYNNPGTGKPWVTTVMDGKYVLRNGPNPYWHQQKPFIAYPYEPSPDYIEGKGLCEANESIQDLLQDTARRTQDNMDFVANGGIFFQSGSIDWTASQIEPGFKIPVLGNPKDVVQQMNMAAFDLGAVQAHMEALKNTGNERDGIYPIMMGNMEGAGSDTATEVSIAKEESNARLAGVVAYWRNGPMQELGQQLWSLTMQTIAEGGPDVVAMITDKPVAKWLQTLDPFKMNNAFDLVFVGSPQMGAKWMEREDALQQLEVLSKIPISQTPPGLAIQGEILLQVFKSFGNRNLEKIEGLIGQAVQMMQAQMAPPPQAPAGPPPAPGGPPPMPPAGAMPPPAELPPAEMIPPGAPTVPVNPELMAMA